VCGVLQVEEGRVRKEEQELKQSELAFDTFLQAQITLTNIARIGLLRVHNLARFCWPFTAEVKLKSSKIMFSVGILGVGGVPGGAG
jgi:hypothetical protein